MRTDLQTECYCISVVSSRFVFLLCKLLFSVYTVTNRCHAGARPPAACTMVTLRTGVLGKWVWIILQAVQEIRIVLFRMLLHTSVAVCLCLQKLERRLNYRLGTRFGVDMLENYCDTILFFCSLYFV